MGNGVFRSKPVAAVLAGVAMTLSASAGTAGDKAARIAGVVARGDAYSVLVRERLQFRLTPTPHGWLIGMADPSASGHAHPALSNATDALACLALEWTREYDLTS